MVCKTVSNAANIQQKRYDYGYDVLEGDSGEFSGDFVKISDFSNLMFKESDNLIADYTISKYKLTLFFKRLVKTSMCATS